MATGWEGGWEGRVMMQDTKWKQGKSVRGEHTGIGRGCRGPPQCSTVHEKTERRNKNRQHANSQQRDDRVKAYTARHHGGCCECSEWSVLWRGKSWGWTGDRSQIMNGRHANWYFMTQKCSGFHKNNKKRRWKFVAAHWECLHKLILNLSPYKHSPSWTI